MATALQTPDPASWAADAALCSRPQVASPSQSPGKHGKKLKESLGHRTLLAEGRVWLFKALLPGHYSEALLGIKPAWFQAWFQGAQ